MNDVQMSDGNLRLHERSIHANAGSRLKAKATGSEQAMGRAITRERNIEGFVQNALSQPDCNKKLNAYGPK